MTDKKINKGILPVLAFMAAGIVLLAFMAHFSGPAPLEEITGDYLDIVLYGNDNPDDLKILNKKLSMCKGAGKAEISSGDGLLHIKLPESAPGDGTNAEEIFLECFLTEPVNLSFNYANPSSFARHYICNADETVISVDWGKTDKRIISEESTFVENALDKISREEDGSDEEVVADFRVYNTRFMRFTVTGDAAALIREKLADGMELRLGEISPDSYETNAVEPVDLTLTPDREDPSVFYYYYNEHSSIYGHEDLFAYNMTHRRLSGPFNYVIKRKISWIRPEPDTRIGENQCSFEDAGENAYVIQFTPQRKLVQEEMDLMLHLLAQRLDAIETPYALGTTAYGNICVRTDGSHLSVDIIKSLISGRYSTGARLWDRNLVLGDDMTIDIPEDGDGLQISLSSYYCKEIESYMEKNNLEREKVFIHIGYIPLAIAEIENETFNGQLVCSELNEPFSGDSERKWTFRLLRELIISPTTPIDLNCDYFCYRDNGYNDESHFGLKNAMDDYESRLLSRIRNEYPDAEITTADTTLRVYLNMVPGEKWPAGLISNIQKSYSLIEFEDSYYTNLMIYPYKTVPDEKVVLSFDKWTVDENKKLLSFDGILFGGRFEKNKGEFKELLKKDTFLLSFERSPYQETIWIFE
ncbi:MAG: hypothetical protein IJH71_05660 [Eubacterium sp.]|nr:hypothetical protein [Eubacterium sp.]